MPRYRIRLEDPNSEEYRVVVTHAASEEEAVALALRNEAKMVAYRAEPGVLADDLADYLDEQEIEKLRAGDAEAVDQHDDTVARALDDMPRSKRRGRLHMHRQAEPYRVVSVKGGEG